MMLELIFLVFVFGVVILYLGAPFLKKEKIEMIMVSSSKSMENLFLKKEEILETLKDYELDRRTNKISEEDYQELHAEAIVEGTEILKEIEETKSSHKAKQESKVTIKKESNKTNKVQAKYCHHCGEALIPEAKFCSQCGKKIN